MDEGWRNNEYWILFAEGEAETLTKRYGVDAKLPGFAVIGLRGWDEFLVRDPEGHLFTVPTVPCAARYLKPYEGSPQGELLQDDITLAGKIKWYIKPIVFGGSPSDESNIAWVTRDQHMALVRWWNDQHGQLSKI